MSALTPPQYANKIGARLEEAKVRRLLEDFADFASLPEEIVDMYLESLR